MLEKRTDQLPIINKTLYCYKNKCTKYFSEACKVVLEFKKVIESELQFKKVKK